jgi:hypothetical protein
LKKIYENYKSEHGITLNKNNFETLSIQHNESFSDMFALHMMSKRYSDINIEELKNLIAGLRYNSKEDSITYDISYGILQFDVLTNATVEEIIEQSSNTADANTSYYIKRGLSSENYSPNAKYIKFVELESPSFLAKIKFLDKFNSFSLSHKNKL